MRRAYAGVMTALVLVACEPDASAVRRAEVSDLGFALRRLREAPNSDKRPQLGALEQVGCTLPDVCEAKRVCVAAYTRHLAALDGLAAARRALRRDGGSASDQRVALLVEKSRRELNAARSEVQRCNTLSAALARPR